MQLSELEQIRRKNYNNFGEGIDPYPAALYPVDHTTEELKNNFEEGKRVTIAGRLMSRQIQGKASLQNCRMPKEELVYFNRDEICPNEDKSQYNEVYKKLLDIGDFIGIEGELFKTKVGEKP